MEIIAAEPGSPPDNEDIGMMKTLLLAGTLLAIAQPAAAGPVTLKGTEAETFIAESFPNADIPGEVSGEFRYDRDGKKGVGHAKCTFPAMGARSEGEVSTCTVWY